MTVVNVNKLYLKKIDTASFQHHNSYQKQYAKKYKQKAKNKIVYFAKEEWRKTGWTIDKIKRNERTKQNALCG